MLTGIKPRQIFIFSSHSFAFTFADSIMFVASFFVSSSFSSACLIRICRLRRDLSWDYNFCISCLLISVLYSRTDILSRSGDLISPSPFNPYFMQILRKCARFISFHCLVALSVRPRMYLLYQVFVNHYICENYSNEWLMPTMISGLRFFKEWMHNFCNHFATTKKGNPLFKRIPTFFRLFHLPSSISFSVVKLW